MSERPRLVRFAADRRSLAIVATYYSTFGLAWSLPPQESGMRLAIAALLCVETFLVAVVTHNTIHHPIFHSPTGNRVFSILLSWAFGAPAAGFVPGHNLSHHRYLGTPRDNVRTNKVRLRWNLLNQALFFFVMIPGIVRTESRYVRQMRHLPSQRAWWLQHRVETAVITIGKLSLLVLDWRSAALFVLLPNLYGVWGIFGTNYWQHDGCDPQHPHNHSRSFTGRWLNFFACNNGYHAAHHEQPGLHWTFCRTIIASTSAVAAIQRSSNGA